MPQEPAPQIPTPMLDKNPRPMDARFLSSVGLGFGTRIGRTQLFPTPMLDKNRFLPKRVVLAEVPSFRFSFRGNMRTYPRSGFRSGGTSECTLFRSSFLGEHPPKPPFCKTTLLSTPDFGKGHREISKKFSALFKIHVCLAPLYVRAGERCSAVFSVTSPKRNLTIRLPQNRDCLGWRGAKGIPTKGIGKNFLKAKKGKFGGGFRCSQGIIRVFSGCFQGVFPIIFADIPFGAFLPSRGRSGGRVGCCVLCLMQQHHGLDSG